VAEGDVGERGEHRKGDPMQLNTTIEHGARRPAPLTPAVQHGI